MSSDNHRVDVMNVGAWVFGIFFLGFLNVTVSEDTCVQSNIEVELISILLKDHLFEIKNFTPPGEQVKPNHIFLSIINTVCSSWNANIDNYTEMVTKDSKHNQKIMWAFTDLLKAEMCKTGKKSTPGNDKQNIKEFCDNRTCINSYCTRYIKPDEFQEIYLNAWSRGPKSDSGLPLMECPVIPEVTVPTLLCPNKSTFISTSTTIKPSTSTVTESYTTSTVGTNGLPMFDSRTETPEMKVAVLAVFLVISMLLNIILLLLYCGARRNNSIYKGPVQHVAENGFVTYESCKNLNQGEDQVELNSITEERVS